VSSSSRLVVVAFLFFGLAPLRGVAAAAPRTIPGCPGYAALLGAAQEALRRGDDKAALVKLREARSALDRCSRGAPAGRVVTAA